MATRTQILTSPGFADAADISYKGISISCYLRTPGGVSVLDLENHILSNGTQYGVGTSSDLTTGAFSLSAVYVGDLRFPDGTPCACQLVVSGANQNVESPDVGYAYASSIDISTWLPTPSATATTLMILDADLVNDAPYLGLNLPIDISVTVVKPDSSVLFAGQPVNYEGSGGRISAPLTPTSVLSVPTARYKITPPGAIWWFDVPVNPTGYQGAWNSGTTYHVHDGTAYQGPFLTPLLTPPDVVLSGSVYYQAVADSLNHVPPNVTYWKPWIGEPIPWHLTTVAITGAVALTTSNLAHDANVPPWVDSPVASPANLHDDMANLAAAAGLATASKSGTYTVTDADDWINVSGASSAWAATLMSVATRRRPIWFFLTNATNPVTITRAGSDTINGAATLVLSTLHQWVCLKPPASGTDWAALVVGATVSDTQALVSAAYAVLTTDRYVEVDCTAAGRTITLPDAATYPVGKVLNIKKWDGTPGSNAVTLNTTSSQHIDTYASGALTWSTQGQSFSLVSNGTNYKIV